MIQITPQMRVVVAVEPADFRKGIDGLARNCKEVLKRDPFSGWGFVFRNRRATAVKVLVYDGQGFRLCYKRLMSGFPAGGWGRPEQRSGWAVPRQARGTLHSRRPHLPPGLHSSDRWAAQPGCPLSRARS